MRVACYGVRDGEQPSPPWPYVDLAQALRLRLDRPFERRAAMANHDSITPTTAEARRGGADIAGPGADAAGAGGQLRRTGTASGSSTIFSQAEIGAPDIGAEA
jgi:hypothetical protein